MFKNKILSLLLAVSFVSCNEYTPKPMGFVRIGKEKGEMIKFERPEFSFLYPSYAKIELLKPEAGQEIWFNIVYPAYQTVIYCTYIQTNAKELPKILDDSHQLAYGHAIKAESIFQSRFTGSGHTTGLIYDINGSVASPVQFYITDNTSEFLRGALYFNSVTKPDSIAPVVSYIRADIVQLMESLEWKK
jgi:gliding motility-associated lipoprotein GldD